MNIQSRLCNIVVAGGLAFAALLVDVWTRTLLTAP